MGVEDLMLLADATSKEEVEAALAEGDDELDYDIRDQLKSLEQKIWNYSENEELVIEDIVRDREDFKDAVVEQSDPDLSDVPDVYIANALADEARRGGIFEWDRGYWSRGFAGFGFTLSPSLSLYLSDSYIDDIEGAEFIPSSYIEDFYKSFRDVDWEVTDRLTEQSALAPGYEDVNIRASEDDFHEFCRDIVREWHRDLVEKDKPAAIKTFIEEVKSSNRELGNKLAQTPPSDDDLIELATDWFESDEDDRGEVIEKIADYYQTISEPSEAEPDLVIATFSRDEIKDMGITKGPLFEQTPWRLIKLKPYQLRLEGTRMKHCVGDKGMGYIQAVKDGEVEIWSLRDSASKPRFTLEVDSSFYDNDDPASKADAIKQLKGAANRTPGHASRGDRSIKFPEEVIFWKKVFKDIGVDSERVDDFDAARITVQSNGRQVRRNSSFDEPYRPLVRGKRPLE